MDFRQLEAYVYTIKYKSFSEAAKKLYLTQPTISSHIRSLEKELNTELISRTTKDFSITAEGQLFFDYSVNILKLREKALSELSKSQTNILQIGASSIPAGYILPEILSSYYIKCNIKCHCFCSDSIDIINRVNNKILDVGLVGTYAKTDNCVFEVFTTDELIIVTPNNGYYRKLQKSNPSFKTLLSEPLILREDKSGTKIEAEEFLKRNCIDIDSLNVISYINNPESIKNCIINGLGISILSKRMVENEVKHGQLLLFPLGNEQLIRNLYIIYNKKHLQAGNISDFIHFIKQFY